MNNRKKLFVNTRGNVSLSMELDIRNYTTFQDTQLHLVL